MTMLTIYTLIGSEQMLWTSYGEDDDDDDENNNYDDYVGQDNRLQ